jgi:hypothetical protein
LLRPWLEAACRRIADGGHEAWVITPSQSVSYFLKERALADGLSLVGIRFLVPAELRKILMRTLRPAGELAQREQLRLLLAAAAEAVSRERGDAAAGVASAPDALLQAVDRLDRAGWDILEELPQQLRPVVKEFRRLMTQCDLRLAGELDRALLIGAAQGALRPEPLLLVGFDGQHWPQWPLLTAAVVGAADATVLLSEAREEAQQLDSLWVGTWEQYFGSAQPLAATERARPFAEMLTSRRAAASRDQRQVTEAEERVDFLVANDPGELAAVIATRVLHDLSQPDCTRVGIVFARPGPLPRLVSLRLSELGVPHNDGIGHPLPGPFERPAWEAWRKVQDDRRVETFVALLRQCPGLARRCGDTTVNAIEGRLRREMSDLLIDDLAVLGTSLAERDRQPLGNAIGKCLREMTWLPECAPLPEFLKATREAFVELHWPERLAELDRATANWLTNTKRTVSRAIWLQWLHDTMVSTSKLREPLGRHPYARAHLLTYGQAESQEWSHVIACDLSEGEWPPPVSDDGWLTERDLAALNSRLPWLNLLATAQGGQGEGHQILRSGHTWCITPSDEQAIVQRQFANLLENTTVAFTAAASLHSATHAERVVQPGELFNRLHFCARGRAISTGGLRALCEETARWTRASGLWTKPAPDITGVEATRRAWEARRERGTPFGEYQFSLRKPPAQPALLSATSWEAALQRPALVWMRTFLGVDEPEPHDIDLAPAALGRWVHRWLATIAPAGEFASIPVPDELERITRAAATSFRDSILSLFTHCSRDVPDWWLGTWQEAAGIAAILARRLGAVSGWEKCAAEWNLGSVGIPLATGETLRVRGRIDLILARDSAVNGRIPGNEAWVIDYKTGDPSPLKPFLLSRGDGIQLALYGLAVRSIGAQLVMMSRVGPSLDLQGAQLTGADLDGMANLWQALASMQDRGTFGQLGPLRSEYGVTATYPLATLAIDEDVLSEKWDLTHSLLASRYPEDALP